MIETIARCFWPDIQAYWESEEGYTEFLEWKAEQEKKQQREEHEAFPPAA